jgi:hypothetical protein
MCTNTGHYCERNELTTKFAVGKLLARYANHPAGRPAFSRFYRLPEFHMETLRVSAAATSTFDVAGLPHSIEDGASSSHANAQPGKRNNLSILIKACLRPSKYSEVPALTRRALSCSAQGGSSDAPKRPYGRVGSQIGRVFLAAFTRACSHHDLKPRRCELFQTGANKFVGEMPEPCKHGW